MIKMKKIILILAMILCATIVTATEGDLEVYSFKVYEEATRLDGDYDSDEFELSPGKNIEVQIRFDNPYNNTLDDVEVWGTLFDVGDDIERSQTIDIGPEDRSDVIVFEYFVPTDTRVGHYDFEFRFDYEARIYHSNSTEIRDYSHDRTFDFWFQKEVVPIEELFLNITKNLVDTKEENNRLISSVINLSGTVEELGSCKSELGSLKTKDEINTDFKGRYFNETEETKRYNNMFSTCNTEKASMFTKSQLDNEVSNKVMIAVNLKTKEKDNFLMIVLGGAWAFWYFKLKPKKTGGQGEGQPIVGTWGKKR